MIDIHKSAALALLLFLWLASNGLPCFAIDNPDAPDIVAEFEARAQKFESDIQTQASSDRDIGRAYLEYEKFLDGELNQTYSTLAKRLNGESRNDLARSQKLWLQFRDAEFLFIRNNWNLENFGTSSLLSRGAYRAEIVRGRVVELLHYLKNYR